MLQLLISEKERMPEEQDEQGCSAELALVPNSSQSLQRTATLWVLCARKIAHEAKQQVC